MSAPQFKHYDWVKLKGDKEEARIYCPACGQSKMLERYKNAFWKPPGLCQCDNPKCGKFIDIKMHDGGVEVMA